MDIRFLFLIILAFVFEVFFLLKDIKFKDSKLLKNNTQIEFVNSKSYKITQNGVEGVLIAKKIIQKKGEKIFFSPAFSLYDKNLTTKNFFAKKAILKEKENIIILKGNVNLTFLEKRFSTNMLKYDLPKKSIIDSDKFFLYSKEILANGYHLFFDMRNNIIKAKNINYKIFLTTKE